MCITDYNSPKSRTYSFVLVIVGYLLMKTAKREGREEEDLHCFLPSVCDIYDITLGMLDRSYKTNVKLKFVVCYTFIF